MKEWLVRRFVRNPDDIGLDSVRQQYGVLGGIVGIVVNLILFAAKFTAGTLFGSIAVTSDAVNNLSDAASSVVTLVSFRMSGKPADKDHPFGHARIEYIAASIVAVVVLLIGFELLKTSIGKIISPTDVTFSYLTIGVLLFSIGMKVWLFTWNKFLGRRINSSVMEATAIDSLSDVLTTSVVLVALVIAQLFHIRLDGWMGAAVACFILYSGIRILKDTVDNILGQGPSQETTRQLESIILGHAGVLGLHDLMVHDYGPNRTYASVHVEVDANVDILLSHELIDDIERDIERDMGIHLVIHLDPIIIDDPVANEARLLVERLLREVDARFSFHDFRMVKGQTHSNLIFDVTAPFECRVGDKEIAESFQRLLAAHDPRLFSVITVDRGEGKA